MLQPTSRQARPALAAVKNIQLQDWLLGLLLLLAGAAYVYLAISRPLVQLSDIYSWVRRANQFPGNTDDAFWIDGFYPVGYPIALRLGFNLLGDYLLAAKAISVGLALVGLLSFYSITRSIFDPWLALLCTVIVATNPLWLEHASMEGTDMGFVGLSLAAIALLVKAVRAETGKPQYIALAAGTLLGLAYLFRYTALSLLVFLLIGLVGAFLLTRRMNIQVAGFFLLGFFIGSALQTLPSYKIMGTMFYNTQYQNVWFGIYGNGDWGSNWAKAVEMKSLMQVVQLSPTRFLDNVFNNITKVLFDDQFQYLPSILALPGVVVALWSKRTRPLGFLLAMGFLGFALTISLAFVHPPRLLLLFFPGAVLFSILALEQLDSRMGSLWSGGPAFRFAMLGAGLSIALNLFVIQPNLSSPLTEEQAAKLELPRKLRQMGITDPYKVYSLTFNLHDPFTPTKSLYAQPWFMTGVRYNSMQSVEQMAKNEGYAVVVTDTQGQWTAPGLDKVWRLDSARILFHEFYSKAGVHGFEVKR